MADLAHHLMLRLNPDRIIAPTEAARRLLAATVLALAEKRRVLAFRAADTHLHVLVAGSREPAGELARRIEIGLSRRLRPGVPFAAAHIRLVRDQAHLVNTFRYVLDQQQHHGLGVDPFHDASNLPDLLGLRLLGAYTAADVTLFLPRIRRPELIALFGVEIDGPIRSFAALGEAAAAAVALPSLVAGSGSRAALEARRAALAVAGDELSGRELQALLAVSERTLRRLRQRQPADPALVAAVTGQLCARQSAAPAQAPAALQARAEAQAPAALQPRAQARSEASEPR